MATDIRPRAWKRPRLMRFVPGWALWFYWCTRGWLMGRHRMGRIYVESRRLLADSRAAIEKAGANSAAVAVAASEKIVEAERERDQARLALSSARAVIAEREQEITHLQNEKAALESVVDLRKLEIEELNRWLERINKRLDADIAQQVARELGAGKSLARPAEHNNAGPH